MTSKIKIAANQKNSEKSTGPTTQSGKRHSSLNALKHGVLSRELTFSASEKQEYEGLRDELKRQHAPSTALQLIAFDRIVCSFLRHKRSLRLEDTRLEFIFEQSEKPSQQDTAEQKLLAKKWYGASIRDLGTAIRFLSDLRNDVEANGWIHAEDWKSSVIQAFGEGYFSMLTRWVPTNIQAIRMAEHLVAHAKLFNRPLPNDLSTDSKGCADIVDPGLSQQMGVKLVELTMQHLAGLAQMNKVGSHGPDSQQAAVALDVASRYVTTTTREMERALRWFMELKDQGL